MFVFLQPTQRLFFPSLFLNSFHISFIHNCFLDCFPLIELRLPKHLSWTLSRLRIRQNKFASGNFILSTIFCGFRHHASKKLDALHVFWKELGLQGKFPTARTSQGSYKAQCTWLAGGSVRDAFFPLGWLCMAVRSDDHWNHPEPVWSQNLAPLTLSPTPKILSELRHSC